MRLIVLSTSLFFACSGDEASDKITADTTAAATGDTGAPNTFTGDTGEITDPPTGCEPGAPVGVDYGMCTPGFALPDSSGNIIDLASFRGQVVLVDIIGMWCGPCQELAPEVEGLYQERRADGFVAITMVAENLSGGTPSLDDAASWESSLGLTYPVVADVDGQHEAWDRGGITVIPMTYILDQEGVIRFFAGGSGTIEEMAYEVDRLLKAPPE
ncbi:MAG TPA: TlpA family protein disulfide reductase [Deltaproteobacteria bacterium]|nr:TlpA family protein disulfide reductase [Deltaproteobacteria bacterium]